MNKLKSLDLLTDILLGSALIAIFSISFFFTRSLSPQTHLEEMNVLGEVSSDFRLLDSPNLSNTVLDSNDNVLKFKSVLTTDANKLINDYRIFELRNTSNVMERYAVYFDLDKSEFQDIQLFLVNDVDSFPIFQARTDDLLVKDIVIEVAPQSLSRYALRTVFLNEDLPKAIDLTILVKSID
jgi:hypothetical protein